MSVFADSSAIVKLYVPEAGHEAVRAIVAPIVVSVLARVEVPAALWGKQRAGELTAEDAAVLVAAFEFDYHGTGTRDGTGAGAFAVIAMSELIAVDAARQAARHGLRAYDSVQLASAIAARVADPGIADVAVFDVNLRRAMLAEGFSAVVST